MKSCCIDAQIGAYRTWLGAMVAVCWLCFAVAPTGRAGQFNPLLKIGDAAPAWSQLPGVDDKTHSLVDMKDKELLVVVFTCNSCPYAVDYEDRLKALGDKYSAPDSKVGVVAINVNRVEADLLPAMKQRAKDKGFQFPYLFDESQAIAKAFGAARTPEFFVLDQQRRIVYMGAMDDNTKAGNVKVRYVEDAIAAQLAGKPVTVAETAPVGCAIRWARERKKP